jgi:hypothetical protein
MEQLLKSEWTKVVVFIFALGVFYNKVDNIESQQKVIEQRLEKKIKIIKDQEKRIRELEKCQ